MHGVDFTRVCRLAILARIKTQRAHKESRTTIRGRTGKLNNSGIRGREGGGHITCVRIARKTKHIVVDVCMSYVCMAYGRVYLSFVLKIFPIKRTLGRACVWCVQVHINHWGRSDHA